jgi:hypothetical protein
MIQRTVTFRARTSARAASQSTDAAFPMAFLALAFGLIAGISMASFVVPAVMRVIPVVVRMVAGS